MDDFKFEKDFLKELTASGTKHKVLLLLSGGKDSICCLYLLSRIPSIELEAICFTHKWSSEIPCKEAIRHCDINSVRLHVIDFSTELNTALKGFSSGRPCLRCKPTMYRIAIAFAEKHKFKWIATGDNANDQTTFKRLEYFNGLSGESRKYCSHYLGNEQGVELPEEISVVRPLLYTPSNSIESFLNIRGIKLKESTVQAISILNIIGKDALYNSAIPATS